MSRIHSNKKAGHADWHPADIVCALRKAGWTYRRLSVHHGYHPHNLCRAKAHPYPAAERLIADAIGVEPWDIWPSRYDADRQPIRQRSKAPLTHHWGKGKRDRTPLAEPRNGSPEGEG